jgi:hypothetical protein
MATGRMPFDGESTGVVYAEILHHQPPPPSSLNSAVPPILDDIIADCPRAEERIIKRICGSTADPEEVWCSTSV